MNDTSKVIGFFSYTLAGNTLCDGDACIIAGSKELMETYLTKMIFDEDFKKQNIIKKTRFGEIMQGLMRGGAYAFDEEAYSRFLPSAKRNQLDDLPEKSFFLEPSPTAMHFARIQLHGGA